MIDAFPAGTVLRDANGVPLSPQVCAELIPAFRAKLRERVLETQGDVQPVTFAHISGPVSYWQHWIKRPVFARNWPLSPALERLPPDTTRKCRKCDTTRWRTLDGDGLCERCDGSDLAAVT